MGEEGGDMRTRAHVCALEEATEEEATEQATSARKIILFTDW